MVNGPMWAEGWVGLVGQAGRAEARRLHLEPPLLDRSGIRQIVGFEAHQSVRPGRTTKTAEGGPLLGRRIRSSWRALECVTMGPVVGLEEVASGEWRVTSYNSRASGRAGGIGFGVGRVGD
jgi:hypothetical protein